MQSYLCLPEETMNGIHCSGDAGGDALKPHNSLQTLKCCTYVPHLFADLYLLNLRCDSHVIALLFVDDLLFVAVCPGAG